MSMERSTASKWRFFRDKIMQKTTLNRVDEEEKGDDARAISSSRLEDGANLSPLHVAAIMGNKSKMSALLREHEDEVDKGDKIGRTPLIYSILGDRYECAEALLKAGADVNKTDVDERTALHWAAYQGNQKFVKLLLDKGALQEVQDKEGQTPLHLSLSHDNIKVMARLLKDVDVDCRDSNGMTALHYSVAYERVEHTKMLLHAKASPDCQDNDKKTVLHWAKTNKETMIISKLLDYERVTFILNSKDSEGRTALHLYVAVDNRKLVRYLTSREDCQLSVQDHMQRTPLHLAAILGHTEIAVLLLSRGCDALKPDNNGVRPLHYAAQNNFGKTLNAMLMHDNVKDMPDNDGRTALMWAAAKGAYDALAVLINHKQDFLASDRSGATAMHMACEGGHLQCVNLLLQNQAGVNVMDNQQYTPLFSACQMGHRDVVETLLLHGAAVDLEDKEGRTPLHWAAVGGNTDICAMLISNGLDVAKRDKLGRPALHYAAYGGFYSCMSLLLESGAEVDARDNTGVTALHWACASGSLDAVKLLVRHNAFFNYVETEGDKLTPLDYAVIRDHQDVAQFMIEHGAFTIAAIQDEAALVIQKTWRGYRLRKSFEEQKRLFILHEKRRKETKMKQDDVEQTSVLPIKDHLLKQQSMDNEEKFAEIFGKSFCQSVDASADGLPSDGIQLNYNNTDLTGYENYLTDTEVSNDNDISCVHGTETEYSLMKDIEKRHGKHGKDIPSQGSKKGCTDQSRYVNISFRESMPIENGENVIRNEGYTDGFTVGKHKIIRPRVNSHRGSRVSGAGRDDEHNSKSSVEQKACDRLTLNSEGEDVTRIRDVGFHGKETGRKDREGKPSKNRNITLTDTTNIGVIERTTRIYNALPTPRTSSSSLYSYASDVELKPWQIYRRERHRKHLIRRKVESAVIIQRAFRSHMTKQRGSADVHGSRTQGSEVVQRDVNEPGKDDNDLEMMKDIAALVIQLHWRRYLKSRIIKEKQIEKKDINVSDTRLLAGRGRKSKSILQPRSPDSPQENPRRKSSSKHRKQTSEQGANRGQIERTELPNINSNQYRTDDLEKRSRDPVTSSNRKDSKTGQKVSMPKQSRYSSAASKGSRDGTQTSSFKIRMPQNWSSNLQKFPLRY